MTPIVRTLGRVDYTRTWQAMQTFTAQRTRHTPDEFWLLEHPPVFTLGQAGRAEHVLAAGDIPVVQSDRGGQVTYHGPGQAVLYVLLDLRRLGIGPRLLVERIEQAVVATLAGFDIPAWPRSDAHGVYTGDRNDISSARKIAAMGLRIRQGCSYHGLALNIDMDLTPFSRINPCGHAGMAVTQVCDETRHPPAADVLHAALIQEVAQRFAAVLPESPLPTRLNSLP